MSFDDANETIIAISTAPGPGAIGIVRLSGPDSLNVLRRHCRGPSDGPPPDFAAHPRRAMFVRVVAEDGGPLDEGLCTFFPGPHSYTGEDTAELALHGNPLLLRRVVQAILSAAVHSTQQRVRPANPGEFTKRAYLHGRMDLTRAEAVHRIITARSERELEAGRRNLGGELARLSSRFRSALIHLKAETEAEVDFSTEDLTFESRDRRTERVRDLLRQLEEIQIRGRETERLRHGVQVALVGVPNAGKSSLMNLMLGWDRSIVSPIAGTTRDYVAEEVQFEGVPLRFVDTAGLRHTEDLVEAAGVRRSRETMDRSQVVLHVIDSSVAPYEFPDLGNPEYLIHVFNKCDIRDGSELYGNRGGAAPIVRISCETGAGLEDLRKLLREYVFGGPAREPLLLEDRHRHHFQHVEQALRRLLELWAAGAPDEIAALEIDTALEHAGAITGRIENEEILGRIFSMFCVGK